MDLASLYRAEYRPLVRFLYRKIGDSARAEELVQEAFVRALQHRPDNPKPWLFQVAANLARDEHRRLAVQRRHLTLVRRETKSSTVPAPDHQMERQQRADRVQQALARLSARDREALLLWEEGFSYAEIAEQMGLARRSVGTTLARARTRLATYYRPLEGVAPGRHEPVIRNKISTED